MPEEPLARLVRIIKQEYPSLVVSADVPVSQCAVHFVMQVAIELRTPDQRIIQQLEERIRPILFQRFRPIEICIKLVNRLSAHAQIAFVRQ